MGFSPIHDAAHFLDLEYWNLDLWSNAEIVADFHKVVNMYYAVDKIFFAGNGLFEVLFHNSKNRDLFLSTPTVLLKQQVVHVLPW